jgi:hypothetical protein
MPHRHDRGRRNCSLPLAIPIWTQPAPKTARWKLHQVGLRERQSGRLTASLAPGLDFQTGFPVKLEIISGVKRFGEVRYGMAL